MLQRHFKAIAFPHIPTAYDLLAHHESGEFLKCQVKTSAKVKEINGSRYWRFKTKKTSRVYNDDEVDFFALVVLPERRVFFLSKEEATGDAYIKESEATEEKELETLHDVLGDYL